MGHLDYKEFYRRHRPHFQPSNSILFVTFRLAGSIPQATIRDYKAKKEWLIDQLKRSQKSTRDTKGAEFKEWTERLEQFKREWFMKFEKMHQAATGPMWMKDIEVADTVARNIHALDGETYLLDAYCIMSNHVHIVFTPYLTENDVKESIDDDGHLTFASECPGLSKIMQLLKGRTARECNQRLMRSGQFLGTSKL